MTNELVTKLNDEKVNLENQWNQLLELAKTKREEYEKVTEEYEKVVQQIRDEQQVLRGRYNEVDNVLNIIEQVEKENAQEPNPDSVEFIFDEPKEDSDCYPDGIN